MPRTIKKIERTKVEEIAESTICDMCGRQSPSTDAQGAVDWGEDGETACWLYTPDADDEIILCPDCFKALKVALPVLRAAHLSLKPSED